MRITAQGCTLITGSFWNNCGRWCYWCAVPLRRLTADGLLRRTGRWLGTYRTGCRCRITGEFRIISRCHAASSRCDSDCLLEAIRNEISSCSGGSSWCASWVQLLQWHRPELDWYQIVGCLQVANAGQKKVKLLLCAIFSIIISSVW